MARGWPLVGRREELTFVSEALADPACAGVVLAGQPGVGKTRLASEALAAASRTGAATIWVIANRALSAIPFGAFASVLPGPAGDDPVQRLDLLRMATRALAERAGGRPLVLGVDDAHLLDDLGAALVQQLAVTAAASVVVTVRTGEPAPDPVVALWKDGLAERLELQPLARGEFGTLLGAALDGHVEGPTVHKLWAVSGGNVLFLRELVLDATEAGRLRRHEDGWRWDGEVAAGPRLSEVVGTRLGHLNGRERELLQLVALGEPLGLALAEELAPTDALAAVEAKELVTVENDGRRLNVRLAHPLYGEVLRAETGPVARLALRRRLMAATEQHGARRADDLLRLATWHLDGAGQPRAELLVPAARRASALLDHVLAERLARSALAAAGAPPFAAGLALAAALNGQGRCQEALEVLVPLEGAGPSDRDTARWASELAAARYWGLGQGGDLTNLLARTEAAMVDGDSRSWVRAVRASVLVCAGRLEEGLEAALPVLEGAIRDPRVFLRAVPAASALALQGHPGSALEVAERAYPLAVEMAEQMPHALGWVVNVQVLALLTLGRLDAAEDVVVRFSQLPFVQRTEEVRAAAAMAVGRLALVRGRVETAQYWLREAAAMFRRHDPEGNLRWCLSLLAQASAARGETPAAAAALAERPAAARSPMRVVEPEVLMAEALVTAQTGELTRARATAMQAARSAAAGGQPPVEASALHLALRLGERQLGPALLRAAAACEGGWAPDFAAHALGLDEGDGSALDAVADRFEGYGAILWAAEAAAQAADQHRAAGHSNRASAAAARSRALQSRCEGAVTPVLATLGSAASSPLTRREREIASLAARGMSNREIAERLVVSVRTVEGHLYQVFAKLGVTRREYLAELLTPLPTLSETVGSRRA